VLEAPVGGVATLPRRYLVDLSVDNRLEPLERRPLPHIAGGYCQAAKAMPLPVPASER
jgi:hypothetical protein